MKRDIPKLRLIAALCASVFSLGLFGFLNQSFGGPSLWPHSSGFTLKASFPDSQNIVSKCLVMVDGFQVGDVDSVSIVHGQAQVVFTVNPQYLPIHANAVAQIGHRTVFGEPIINLSPGSSVAPALRSGASVHTEPTVEPDEALDVFDPATRTVLTRGLRELARGFGAGDAGAELNGTIAGIDATITQLRAATTELDGQQSELASLVDNGATVLDAIGARSASLRELIGSARTVGDTLAGEHSALGNGIDQLDSLLATAGGTLPRVHALLTQATPVVRAATQTAEVLSPALAQLRPVVRDARTVIESLRPAANLAVPALRTARAALAALGPLGTALGPAFENVVPIVRYLQSQLGGLQAFIANVSDTVDHGDSTGNWLKGFLQFDPTEYIGRPPGCVAVAGGICKNAYPSPGDASNPQPYKPGSYPRLMPFKPKLG